MRIDSLPHLSDDDCERDEVLYSRVPAVEAAEPSPVPDGFPAISDERLAQLISETKDKTVQSALLELHTRRGADPRADAKSEPALYTLGLTVPELVGQLLTQVIDARRELAALDTMIDVAAAALRSPDCDCEQNVADVLQNVAWGNLDNARHALETAQQFIVRLEQLQGVSNG